jgi:23S rRNA pseudouridine2605 synthase
MNTLPVIKALVLSHCGSRREMAAAIKAGRVAINGEIVSSFVQSLDADSDSLTLDGETLKMPSCKLLYILLNKPLGVLCTTKDTHGRQTVMDLLPPHLRHHSLHTVGRLDMDSCGLVIITNDGNLTYRLTHPRFKQEKEYVVTLDRHLSQTDKDQIESGIILSDGPTSPVVIRSNHAQPNTWFVTMHEGRKRQLRRMFTAMGYHILELKRIREGHLLLGDLPTGHIRLLTAQEVVSLQGSTKPVDSVAAPIIQ